MDSSRPQDGGVLGARVSSAHVPAFQVIHSLQDGLSSSRASGIDVRHIRTPNNRGPNLADSRRGGYDDR